MTSVLERYKKIQSDISSQNTDSVLPTKIIAVSKTFPLVHIKPLIDFGHNHFGENKGQEAEHKWKNKVKKAISVFDYIHSVDSKKLAETLKKNENEQSKKLSYFIQVNFAEEKQKSGISALDAISFYKYCNNIKLNIIGIMCFPPFGVDPTNFFKQAFELNKKIGLKELSMGMSNDYLQAIKYGSTFVRVGSGIFGERKLNE